MSYEKDSWIVSVVWGRIGAGALALGAFVLGLVGYTLSPEDQQTALALVTALIAGVGGMLAIISKVRESKKVE